MFRVKGICLYIKSCFHLLFIELMMNCAVLVKGEVDVKVVDFFAQLEITKLDTKRIGSGFQLRYKKVKVVLL